MDELYAGALDGGRLSAAIGDIARIAGADGGYIYSQHRGDDRMRFAVFSNIDLAVLHKIDPDTARMVDRLARSAPLGRVQSVASVWPLEEMKKSDFYQDVIRNLGILHGAEGLAVRNPDYYGVAILTRSERAGPFSEEQFHTLQAFVPHLRNLFQIVNTVGGIVSERAALAAALDALSDGVAMTDSKGRIAYMNRAAERMTASRDGLSVKAGILRAALPDEERALHRAIGLASSQADGLERGGACTVSRPSGAPPWLLLAAPCSDAQAAAVAPSTAACAVFIRDNARRERHGAEALRRAYGLTFQESNVALAIAEGGGLAEAARSLGLSALTVRNHLQRVFAKTGTKRQAELVKLAARFSN